MIGSKLDLEADMAKRIQVTGLFRAIVAAGALAAASMSQAATVTVHSVIDLTQWNLTGGPSALGTAPDSASFTQGDTIIVDIDFLGDQT